MIYKKKNGSPDANQNDPRTDAKSCSRSSIPQTVKKIKGNPLRELRVSKNIPAKEIIKTVREIYPKYDKILQSKCEHGDEYGIEIRYDAMDALIAKYAPELLEAEKRKRRGGHRLTKRIACRLEDDEYDSLVKWIKKDGFDQMNAWLVFMVRQYLRSKTENTASNVYNTQEALKAQAEYCEKRGIPHFAPGLDGKCYRCNRDIYRPFTHPDGHVTGITIEKAKNSLVTGCPHCNYSFVD